MQIHKISRMVRYKGAYLTCKLGRDLNLSKQPYIKAFTLAEVLITLVIIGVVAALTIPSVVVSYQKHETVTRLKKAYTTIAQTTNKAIADNGPIKNWEIESENGHNETKKFVDKYVAPYLNVLKNCGYETTGACEFTKTSLTNPSLKSTYDNKHYKLILNDGSALFFKTGSSYAGSGSNIYLRTHSIVHIDVNGQKGPNMWGKDIFHYIYWINNGDLSGTFKPDGAYEDREGAKTYCNNNGRGCANLIMLDNWQIKDDYPW